MKTHTLKVNNMHCNSCVILTETELKTHPSVKGVKASLHSRLAEITGDFGDKTPKEIAAELSPIMEKFGYSLSAPEEAPMENLTEDMFNKVKDFRIAIPASLGFIALFILLQKLGVVNLVNSSEVGFGTAFAVGIVASLSTCMAVVGGLVLSVSTTFAKEGDKIRPQIYFHLGRLISFFILGGIIGVIGSTFQLGIIGTFILGLLVSFVMLILGLNLLDLFHWSKSLQPTMPKFISRHVMQIKKANHSLTPVLLGIATFFLPCGFTQSMQIYTLTTGNFWTGAMTMFAFALGTFPVLALLSFSSLSISKKASGAFFKTAGLVVIFFGLFNLLNSFTAIGWLPPLFNF